MKRIIMSSCFGNALQVYDVAIYAFLAPVIAPQFFPHQQRLVALLGIFVVFFAGFLARPVGALLLGRLGDCKGRKYALILSMWLTAVASFCIGVLPTYSQLGFFAAALLGLLRIVQGLASGGEIGGSAVFLVEHAADHRRGLWGSFAAMGMNAGALVAALLAAVLSLSMPKHFLYVWGWRIPFFVAALGGLLVLYIRKHIPETQVYKQLEENKAVEDRPLLTMFKNHKQSMLKVCLLGWLTTAGIYIIFAYNAAYLHSVLSYSLPQAMLVTTFVLLMAVLSMPIAGWMSDKMGRRFLLLLASLFLAVGVLLYYVVASHHVFLHTLFASLFVSIPFGCYLAVVYVLMTELITAHVRYSTMSFAYSMSDAIFGGPAPMLMTWVIARTHNIHIPALYIAVIAIATFILLLSMKVRHPSLLEANS